MSPFHRHSIGKKAKEEIIVHVEHGDERSNENA